MPLLHARFRIMFATMLACVMGFAVAPSAEGATSSIARISCTDSHRLADDPIVYPGKPGASHLHEFTGSWSTNAHSTEAEMRASGHTCGEDGDTAGYWTPTMHRPDGTIIRKTVTTAYYVGSHKDHTKIKPFPAGLKMIADMDKSLQYGSGYHCGNSRTPTTDEPVGYIPTCPTSNKDRIAYPTLPEDTRVEAKLVFPDCWDGKNLDSPDHRSHMAYFLSRAEGCPASHPVSVPRLNLKQIYETYGGPGITLSSGSATTYHGDFWNTWDQAKFETFVQNCVTNPDGSDAVCGNGLDEDRWENPNYPKPTKPGESPFSWPPVDDQASPTNVTLGGLTNGQTYSGVKTLTATATDNTAVSRVELLMDVDSGYRDDDDSVGGHEMAVDNTAPYSFNLDTACMPNGSHTLVARAVDKTGRAKSSTVYTVNTSNTTIKNCAETGHNHGGGTVPPPATGPCDSGSTAVGSVPAGGTVSPSTGDFTTGFSGTLKGCLVGDTAADFSLTLKKQDSSGAFVTVASSNTAGTSTESVSYAASAGTYRWRIQSHAGSGAYTFKQYFTGGTTPPPPPPVLKACEDGEDNDSDGKIDYPGDPGCSSPTDTDEKDPPKACGDTIDNDLDGKVDMSDPGCTSLTDDSETDPVYVCEGYAATQSTVVYGTDDQFEYTTTAPATHIACLDVPAGKDFDLSLRRRNTDGSVTVVKNATVVGNGIDESYKMTGLSAGNYFVKVTARNNSTGSYGIAGGYVP